MNYERRQRLWCLRRRPLRDGFYTVRGRGEPQLSNEANMFPFQTLESSDDEIQMTLGIRRNPDINDRDIGMKNGKDLKVENGNTDIKGPT